MSQPRKSALLRRFSHPAVVAALVAGGYLAQAGQVVAHPQRYDYIKMDYADARNGSDSPAINDAVAAGPVHRNGYDGQFFFYMALDPLRAGPYLGNPAYRYGRIGYPLVARAAALGRPQWIRASLVLVNAVAIVIAVFFLGLLLVRWGASPWWAIVFATYPGLMLFAYPRDTSEPLACALAIAGLWLVARDSRGRHIPAAAAAGLVLAAAALVRETSFLFTIAAVIALVARRERTAAAVLAVVGGAPFLAWKLFLAWHYGNPGSGNIITSPVPLNGLFAARPWSHDQVWTIATIVVPVLVWLALTIRVLWTRRALLVPLTVVINCALFLVLGKSVYDGYGSTGRVATMIAAAAVLGYPAVRDVWGRSTAVAGLMLWSLPWWLAMGPVTKLIS